MDIAIIGSGISGLVAGHHLHRDHQIVVFEADDRIGGHTNTVDVQVEGQTWPVDTGFIVFNHKTYPHFTRLLDELGVASKSSSMSFSVKCEHTGLEYNGTNLDSLFAQRRNLFRPRFWGMIHDILHFNKQATAFVKKSKSSELTLGEFLAWGNYSELFISHYILPMGSAIWSASRADMLAFPMHFFASFFHNHGMLSVNERPQWRVVEGGSNTYVKALTAPWVDQIRTGSPVSRVRRAHGGAYVTVDGREHFFDAVIFATHADQALKILADPSEEEESILSALPYQKNEAILHTDTSVLPKKHKAWAAWNYHLFSENVDRVAVTYNMNILQGFHQAPETFCVTLNYEDAIDPDKIISRVPYAHPLFTENSIEAQADHHKISGHRATYYCGAYWFNGFHEDGVRSGLRVVDQVKEAATLAAVPGEVVA